MARRESELLAAALVVRGHSCCAKLGRVKTGFVLLQP
jgi:hypothetical protein